jgi:hypothetical protein
MRSLRKLKRSAGATYQKAEALGVTLGGGRGKKTGYVHGQAEPGNVIFAVFKLEFLAALALKKNGPGISGAIELS